MVLGSSGLLVGDRGCREHHGCAMTRIIELFVLVNALAGIATFLGVRFAWRYSKHKAKRGFQVINVDKEECPVCEIEYSADEMFLHISQEHPEELAIAEERWKKEGRLTNSEPTHGGSSLGLPRSSS